MSGVLSLAETGVASIAGPALGRATSVGLNIASQALGVLSLLKQPTPVYFGDVQVESFEIPEALNFGGTQTLNVQVAPGGQRWVNAMGANPDPISGRGFFYGSGALDRALLIDVMRKQGDQITLSWDTFVFRVVIASFKPSYQSGGGYIPYEISFEVVQDASDQTQAASPTLASQASGDAISASGNLLSGVSDAASSAWNAVSSVTGQVQSSVSQFLDSVAP